VNIQGTFTEHSVNIQVQGGGEPGYGTVTLTVSAEDCTATNQLPPPEDKCIEPTTEACLACGSVLFPSVCGRATGPFNLTSSNNPSEQCTGVRTSDPDPHTRTVMMG
jgi:hypothetical protein